MSYLYYPGYRNAALMLALGLMAACSSNHGKKVADSRAQAGVDFTSLHDRGLPVADGPTGTVDGPTGGTTGTVAGTVRCSCGPTTPVPGVTVSIGARSTQATPDGSYSLTDVPVGSQTITSTGSKFHNDYSATITVKPGMNTHNIVMQLK